jgi:ribose transport system permease protein
MTTDTTSPPTVFSSKAAFIDRFRSAIPFVTLVLLYVGTVIVAPGYLEPVQLGALLQLAALLGIVAIGQTLVILIAGIDLSVSAVVTFTNLMTGTILAGLDVNLPLALAVSLAFGAAVGFVNGFVITRLKVPDLVATLATFTIVIGIGYLATNGAPHGGSSPGLNAFMTSRFAAFLTPGLLLWLALSVLVIVLLARTSWGRRVYAVGLNRAASHYAGVGVHRMTITLYAISGLTAGLAGFLLTGYTGSSYLGSGLTYQLASIAAVVLGGTSIFGGRGGYLGTMAGVLITVLLQSILRVIGIPQAGQYIAYGVVILVMIMVFTSRKRGR